MPRNLRYHGEGAIYHVFNRGNRKEFVIPDDAAKRRFLYFLKEAVTKFAVRVIGYSVMGNHFHLILQAGQNPISECLHRLEFRYAQYFNNRFGLSGHVFEDRFKATLIDSNAYLL